MTVRDDHGGRVEPKAVFDDFPRIHRRLSQRAAKELGGIDDPVLGIEADDNEGLVLTAQEVGNEEVAYCRRCRERFPGQLLGRCPTQQLGRAGQRIATEISAVTAARFPQYVCHRTFARPEQVDRGIAVERGQ